MLSSSNHEKCKILKILQAYATPPTPWGVGEWCEPLVTVFLGVSGCVASCGFSSAPALLPAVALAVECLLLFLSLPAPSPFICRGLWFGSRCSELSRVRTQGRGPALGQQVRIVREKTNRHKRFQCVPGLLRRVVVLTGLMSCSRCKPPGLQCTRLPPRGLGKNRHRA